MITVLARAALTNANRTGASAHRLERLTRDLQFLVGWDH